MAQSRRDLLKALAVSSPLAGCIEIEEEKEFHEKEPEKYPQRNQSEGYDERQRRPETDEDYGPEVIEKDDDELEPDNDVDIGEELEEDRASRNPESSGCHSGYLETRMSISTGETVHFEEPSHIEGGQYSREGYLTNEGDRVKIEYGPSVLYLDGEGDEAYFSFEKEEGIFGGYGYHKGRYFGLHESGSETEVFTGLLYDALGPDRREAIGVCIDQ